MNKKNNQTLETPALVVNYLLAMNKFMGKPNGALALALGKHNGFFSFLKTWPNRIGIEDLSAWAKELRVDLSKVMGKPNEELALEAKFLETCIPSRKPILQHILQKNPTPVNNREITDATGIPYQTVSQMICELVKAGILVVMQEGRKKRLSPKFSAIAAEYLSVQTSTETQ